MFPWINIELTSRCNKSCSFCGRAKARKAGMLPLGDIEFDLIKHILTQFQGQIVQFNKDGEPLLYERIYDIPSLCKGKVTNIVTNGKLLYERRRDIMLFSSICVSVIEDDGEQFDIIRKYVKHQGIKPLLIIKFLGDYYNPEFERMGLQVTRRTLHSPLHDSGYKKQMPNIPEVGICLELLLKPSIDWQGNFYICNRFDPEGSGIIGNVRDDSIKDIWEGTLRKRYLLDHLSGLRGEVPLCKTCEFWGIPRCE